MDEVCFNVTVPLDCSCDVTSNRFCTQTCFLFNAETPSVNTADSLQVWSILELQRTKSTLVFIHFVKYSFVKLAMSLPFSCLCQICSLFVSVGVRGKPRMYLSLAGFLYRPLWTFQLWTPGASVPTVASRTLAAEVGTLWAGNEDRKFCLNADFHGTFRELLHAANLRHGTRGFTSLPKEGVLRIFPPLKNPRLEFYS
jgi:hypothetical protein